MQLSTSTRAGVSTVVHRRRYAISRLAASTCTWLSNFWVHVVRLGRSQRANLEHCTGTPQVEARGSNGADLADWRGEIFSHMRQLIKAADPNIVEEWKWMGTPVWSHDGIVCTGEPYKSIVKLTFAEGHRCRIRPGSSTRASTGTRGA
jgi:hypothetical protein